MGSVAAVLFDCRMGFTLLPTSQLIQRPSGTPSFAARRKIEEKGVSRGCGPLNPLELIVTGNRTCFVRTVSQWCV